MSMCFDRFVPMVAVVRSIAPLLSICIVIGASGISFISYMILLIHQASRDASDAAMYSASLELVAVQVCTLELYEIGDPDSIKMNLLTDLRLSVCGPPQSESLNAIGVPSGVSSVERL